MSLTIHEPWPFPSYKRGGGVSCLPKAELWGSKEIALWKSFVNCKKLDCFHCYYYYYSNWGFLHDRWKCELCTTNITPVASWQGLVFKICEKVENVLNLPSCLALVKDSFGRIITFSILKYTVSLSIETMWVKMSYV